jgi:hypothetical protein
MLVSGILITAASLWLKKKKRDAWLCDLAVRSWLAVRSCSAILQFDLYVFNEFGLCTLTTCTVRVDYYYSMLANVRVAARH